MMMAISPAVQVIQCSQASFGLNLAVCSKTCVKWPLSKRPKIGFQDKLSLNAGEHFAILSTFINLPFVIKIFVLSIFERSFYAGFTVCRSDIKKMGH